MSVLRNIGYTIVASVGFVIVLGIIDHHERKEKFEQAWEFKRQIEEAMRQERIRRSQNTKKTATILHNSRPKIELVTDYYLEFEDHIEALQDEDAFYLLYLFPSVVGLEIAYRESYATALKSKRKPLRDLPDLNIFIIRDAKSECGENEPKAAKKHPSIENLHASPSAIYCKNLESIFVRRETGERVGAGNLTPAFFHELAHYMYDRAETADSPFLAEGEATAAGERTYQVLGASEQALRNPTPAEIAGLRTLERHLRGEAVSPEEVEAAKSAHLDRMARTPLTGGQVQHLCRVSQEGLSAENIAEALLLTWPEYDELWKTDIKQLQLFYARAWAVYAQIREDLADGVDELGWIEVLDSSARDVTNGMNPRVEDLRDIAARTGAWVAEKVKTNGGCR